MNYVVGFRFNKDRSRVVLIHKNKPDWQKGVLNGVGGKVEPDERPLAAMIREFEEETGRSVLEWHWFCTLEYRGGLIYFYHSTGDLDGIYSKTDEEVTILPVDMLRALQTIPNLKWLIPLALDKDNVTAIVRDQS